MQLDLALCMALLEFLHTALLHLNMVDILV